MINFEKFEIQGKLVFGLFAMNKIVLKIIVLVQQIFTKVAYFLGPVCVLFAIVLILIVSFTYFTSIFPHYVYDGYYFIITFFHLIWAIWASFNILFNYILCIITSPGYTKEFFKVCFLVYIRIFAQLNLKNDIALPKRTREEYTHIFDLFDFDDNEKVCYHCNKPKPPRCHHCSICNQ